MSFPAKLSNEGEHVVTAVLLVWFVVRPFLEWPTTTYALSGGAPASERVDDGT